MDALNLLTIVDMINSTIQDMPDGAQKTELREIGQRLLARR
jgi:hypothetical protein